VTPAVLSSSQLPWIDTHAHLDAAELGLAAASKKNRQSPGVGGAFLAIQNVAIGVLPAVERSNWQTVRGLAEDVNWGYGLGIHPMYTPQASADDLVALSHELAQHANEPRCVCVGEVGLDLFVPQLKAGAAIEWQIHCYREQLKLAKKHALPVVLHVRRSADLLLHELRRINVPGGIAHAFNGSAQQAHAFVDLGFKLGFGGAMTFPRALQLRELARTLPMEAIVLETDSPDIPPQWLYVDAERRAAGVAQGINTPAQLPRIGAVLAELRGSSIEAVAQATARNALAALPKLQGLLRDAVVQAN
jgi:TatD DNase family protein